MKFIIFQKIQNVSLSNRRARIQSLENAPCVTKQFTHGTRLGSHLLGKLHYTEEFSQLLFDTFYEKNFDTVLDLFS